MTEPPTVPRSETGPAPDGGGAARFSPFAFGGYDVLEEIGRGGMGVVYRARQRDLDRDVAIKMILAPLVAQADVAARFHREARAAARVSHPNIVNIYETGQLHGQHYIAMQLVEGRNLAELCAAGSLSLADAVRTVAAVTRAVQHLHDSGILHRDLKPSNILVDAGGRPFVTDFGLAQVQGQGVADATESGIVAGTPGYIAPEIVRGGEACATPRSDIYSLGAVLYQAATGRPPFAHSSPAQALINALEKDPIPPRAVQPRVPVDLETIILACLEREPDRRYTTAEALAEDLERWLVGDPIQATPPAGLHRARRWIRGHTSLASRLGGFAIFFAITCWNTWVAAVVSRGFMLSVAACLALWCAASVACDVLQHRYPRRVAFAWATFDVAMMTILLVIADGVASPLLLAFPLLIATAGFWYRVSLVAYTTGSILLAYAVLTFDTAVRRPELQVALDRHLVFCSVVLLTGLVIGMQTRRARAISLDQARRR